MLTRARLVAGSITCQNTECGYSESWEPEDGRDRTSAQVVAHFYNEGWRNVLGMTFCPCCAPKSRVQEIEQRYISRDLE